MKKWLVGMLAALSIGLGAWQFPELEIIGLGRPLDCGKLSNDMDRLDKLIEINKKLAINELPGADQAVQKFMHDRDQDQFYYYWSSCREV